MELLILSIPIGLSIGIFLGIVSGNDAIPVEMRLFYAVALMGLPIWLGFIRWQKRKQGSLEQRFFCEFNIGALKAYAGRWARQFAAIELDKIVLCRNMEKGWPFSRTVSPPASYALIFIFRGCRHVNLSKDISEYPNEDDDRCTRTLKEIKHAAQYAPRGIVGLNRKGHNLNWRWLCMGHEMW